MFDNDGNPIKDAEATVDQDQDQGSNQDYSSEINDLLDFPTDDAAEESNDDTSSFQAGASARDATAVGGGGALEADGGAESSEGGLSGADGDAEGGPGASEGGVAPGAPGGEGDDKSVTDGEGDKAPEAGADPPEVAELKERVAALTQLVEQASAGQVRGPESSAQPAAQPEAELPNVNLAEAFKDVDLDDVLESKEKFLDFFGKAAGMIYQQGQRDFMSRIPSEVNQSVQRTMNVQQSVDQFYQSNPELTPVKGYVANVAKGISAEHPDWALDQILEEASTRARAALKIPAATAAPAAPQAAVPGKKPALPGGTRGANAPKKQSSSEQDEINDLIFD